MGENGDRGMTIFQGLENLTGDGCDICEVFPGIKTPFSQRLWKNGVSLFRYSEVYILPMRSRPGVSVESPGCHAAGQT